MTGTVCLVIAWKDDPAAFMGPTDDRVPLHRAVFFEDPEIAEQVFANLHQHRGLDRNQLQLEWVSLDLPNR